MPDRHPDPPNDRCREKQSNQRVCGVKIVINGCFGGFGLSPEAIMELWKRGGPVRATPADPYFGSADAKNEALARWRKYLAGRENPDGSITVFSPDELSVLYLDEGAAARSAAALVSLVEEMGAAANGPSAALKIVEVPDDVDWEIVGYDGKEHVAEKHRSWS